jgi:hypothetical protein
MHNQKGFVLLILIIVSLLILAIVAYFFSPKSISVKLPNSSPTVSFEPTTNWKTYTNTDFGFQYPQNLIIKNQDSNFIGNIKKIVISNSDGSVFAEFLYNLDLNSSMLEYKQIQSINNIIVFEAVHPNGYPDSPTPFLVKDLRNSKLRVQFVFYNYSETINLQNQILSTFKFVE